MIELDTFYKVDNKDFVKYCYIYKNISAVKNIFNVFGISEISGHQYMFTSKYFNLTDVKLFLNGKEEKTTISIFFEKSIMAIFHWRHSNELDDLEINTFMKYFKESNIWMNI